MDDAPSRPCSPMDFWNSLLICLRVDVIRSTLSPLTRNLLLSESENFLKSAMARAVLARTLRFTMGFDMV